MGVFLKKRKHNFFVDTPLNMHIFSFFVDNILVFEYA